MNKTPRSLLNANITNKTVLVRVDYNVEFKDGSIVDDFKIRSTISTIQHLLKNNCKVVLLSHRGDPKGKSEDSLSLMEVRFVLGRLLEKQIKFANILACENSIKFMDFGEVLMIENLRFSTAETSKKQVERDEYVKTLVKLGDLYVFEALGIDMNVASVSSFVNQLPVYMGLHFEEEINTAKEMAKNKDPLIAVLGGENTKEQLDFMQALVNKNNTILLGNGLANYFLACQGVKVGDAELDSKLITKAEKLLKTAKKNNCEIVLPVDHICSSSKDVTQITEVPTQQVAKGLISQDIGAKTLVTFREILEGAKRVIWEGAMGNYTIEAFNKGTEAVGEYIALSTPKDCYKVAFGIETSTAMNVLKIKPKRFNFLSLDHILVADFMQNIESDILRLLSKNIKK